jgi:hypothetical protein
LTDETITIEDVFEGILEDTGEDFFKAATGFDKYNVWYVKSKEKFLWHAPDNNVVIAFARHAERAVARGVRTAEDYPERRKRHSDRQQIRG